jgi:N-methylhydantoinase A
MGYRVGVDIGGTFTDFCVLDESTNRLHSLKVFSTPAEPGAEVIAGLRALKERYGIAPEAISHFTHGTTVGVNTIIQRNGAKLCLLTTEHFEDVLELGRLKMPDVFNLFSVRPRPLVPKSRVIPVRERILWDGTVERPLDEASAEAAIRRAQALGADGIVVSLLNAYRNPAHERRIKEIAARMVPRLVVVLSSEVWPIVRESARTVTAVINGYVQPRMSRYLGSLQAALRSEGVAVEPLVTKSNGGVMRAESGKHACVDVLLSGTAAGVTGACHVARLGGFADVASLDIGGTSADVALIVGGEPQYGTGEQVGDFNLYIPSVAVSSIGGGGGSIAWVDEQGVLKSGPASAGSDPGPACYGRGGDKPTTTDAFLLCGFLGQTELAYGAVRLRRDLAEAAIGELARRLSRSPEETAESIIEVAVSGMYVEMTKLFARHGADPKSFALMAFGGAGPMIACFLARELKMETILVPTTPGVLSALGGVVSDTKNDFIRTVYEAVEPPIVETLREAYGALAGQAERWLRDEQGHRGALRLAFSADMRYAGQSFEIETPLEESWIRRGDLGAIAAAFHERHRHLYDYCDREAAVQVINARVVVSAENPKPDFPRLPETDHEPEAAGEAEVYYDGRRRTAKLYRRAALRPGARFAGPAIVAQEDTTNCVLDGFGARVDGFGNLVLRYEGPRE